MNLLAIFIIYFGLSFGNPPIQDQAPCKVLLESISGSYEGDCKKGLAHGKGKAVGEDTYEGTFKKGFPEGEGKYTWANGDYYEGEFKKGKIEGEGTRVMAGGDITQEGFFLDGEYIGKETQALQNPQQIRIYHSDYL